MDAYPHEAQLIIVSVLTAVGIAGPLALLGPSNVLAVSRWVAAFFFRRKLASLAFWSLIGGGSFLGTGALDQLVATNFPFASAP